MRGTESYVLPAWWWLQSGALLQNQPPGRQQPPDLVAGLRPRTSRGHRLCPGPERTSPILWQHPAGCSLLPPHPTSALCSGLQVWSALGRLILQSRVSKGHTGPSPAKGAGLPGTASCGEMRWGQAAELLGLLHGAPQTRGLAEHQSLPSRFWKSRCQQGWSFLGL